MLGKANPASNLEPGGWIEQVEININILSDDSTLPADSHLAKFGSIFEACGRKAGKPLDICDRFEDWIKEAGFTNVQKTEYKVPCGEWPKLPVYKDVGRVCLKTFKQGLEGWVIWFLTHYGDPEPWTIEQVQVYLALMRKSVLLSPIFPLSNYKSPPHPSLSKHPLSS